MTDRQNRFQKLHSIFDVYADDIRFLVVFYAVMTRKQKKNEMHERFGFGV